METKFEVIPIFPTALYGNVLPEQLVLDHISLLDNEKIVGKEEGIDTDHSGERSLNTYILNEEPYKNLSNYILQHATNYSKNYTPYQYGTLKFSQSWISVKNPNHSHTAHFHGNSYISGVLFYGKYLNDTSKIVFHRARSASSLTHPLKRGEELNDFSYSTFSINYQPNLLILFPSILKHSVSKNITNIPRKSLAFNIVPKEGFGSEDSLTELKFN